MRKLFFTGIMYMLLVMPTKAQEKSTTDKVAILPIAFIGDGSDNSTGEMRYRLQEIVSKYLSEKATAAQVQDPTQTNVLLSRNGIRPENFRDYTPEELATTLKVQYVVMGRVTQENNGSVTHNNRYREEHERRRGSSTHSESVSRSTDLINTYIDINIYSSDGTNIYSKSRKSILYDVDAYRNGLHYLLKRSPLLKK